MEIKVQPVKRPSGISAEELGPELFLRKATQASSSRLRAKYATRGLSFDGADRTTRAMLLRQLYLSHMEAERFPEALEAARQAAELSVLVDVARQDIARAHLGLGDELSAIAELRRAARLSPASRRSFHLWTLGSVLYLRGDAVEAVISLEKALRWGTGARPLYRAQLGLARLAAGQQPGSLTRLRDELRSAPCGQGYGQFVLGELCEKLGKPQDAKDYLESFVAGTLAGRKALQIGLRGELARAQAILKRL